LFELGQNVCDIGLELINVFCFRPDEVRANCLVSDISACCHVGSFTGCRWSFKIVIWIKLVRGRLPWNYVELDHPILYLCVRQPTSAGSSRLWAMMPNAVLSTAVTLGWVN
jgi:hypothetical protein